MLCDHQYLLDSMPKYYFHTISDYIIDIVVNLLSSSEVFLVIVNYSKVFGVWIFQFNISLWLHNRLTDRDLLIG